MNSTPHITMFCILRDHPQIELSLNIFFNLQAEIPSSLTCKIIV